MQLTNTLKLLLSSALPIAVNAAIAISKQIKADGVHYNVDCAEGIRACNNHVSIAMESSRDRFGPVNGNTDFLEGCADPDTGYLHAPAGLPRQTYTKPGCSWNTHDVVTRYLCR